MADRAKKISELTALSAASGDDLLVVVDSPSSNATTKKITITNVFNTVAANVNIGNTYFVTANNANIKNLKITRKETAAVSSNTADKEGQMWFDDNYIYVCTANGTVKRATLSTF